MVKYTYSLSSDFGGNIDREQFHNTLYLDGDLTSKLEGIEIDQDVVDIHFNATLTGPEQTTLNSLISGHTPSTSNATVVNSHFQYLEATSLIESTQRDLLQVASLSTNHMIAGYHKIEWYYEWSAGVMDSYFKCRIQLDNTTTVHEYETTSTTGISSKYTAVTGFKVINFTDGVHTIDLDYCTSKSYSSIRNIRILINKL